MFTIFIYKSEVVMLFSAENSLWKITLYGLRMGDDLSPEPSGTHPPKCRSVCSGPELLSAFSSCQRLNNLLFLQVVHVHAANTTLSEELDRNQFQWRSSKSFETTEIFEAHYHFFTHLDLLCLA